jgi:DNA helicase-2/ATP-dependent DNA helicase PcrA
VDLTGYTTDAVELRPGFLVEHEQFGRGKIVEIEYAGESTRALVDFRSHGRKHLIVKYARLKIVQEWPADR